MNTYKNILADKFVRETNYVIIHDTDNLDELEEQWDAFNNIMTSRQRKISDERSTAIWNMSNKQHYEYLKEQIISNMSKNMDDDVTLSEDSSIHQTYDNDSEEIEKFEADSNLHIIGDIEGSTNIEKLKNLEKQYNDFATMVNDNKKVSDEESRRIYGMTNTERYNKLRAVLLAKCLEDEEKAKTIKPVDNSHLYITKQVTNEGFVGECYREKIIREKAESDKRHKHVLNDLPYFTPQEMIDMGVHKRDNFYSDEPDSEGLTDNITIPLWFASYQDMCMNHVFEDYRKEWISKLLELYSNYEQIKESGDNKRILARKQSILDLGWNPEIPFTSENRIKASKRVNNIIENTIPKDIFINLDNIYDPGEDYIEEEATAQTHSPVLLVFTKGKTPVISDGIKFVTKSEYSHVSISFDPKLQEVFSYNINPKYNGFLRENLSTFGDNVISVFAFFIDKLKAKSLKDKILDFESDKTTFDMRIFVNKVLHIDRKVSANEYKQVCSTFVDHILKSGGVNLVGNQQLPAPGDLYNGAKTLPNKIIEVFDGIASTYKGSIVKRKLDHLLRNSTPAINESVNNYYRVTCSGYGIYNVLKKNMYDINKDSSEWIKFKNSKACSWLPLPPSYCENNQSYFTELGYRKFMKETYPIICKYIDKKSIDVEQRSLNEKCIVYRDQYQVVIDESINEVAKVNDKGEQVPETCPKCGSKVGVFFRGEPVFVCTNKECEEYFGVVPCRKHKNESSDVYYNSNNIPEEDNDMLFENLNDIKNGVNPYSKTRLYHVSFDDDLDGKTLTPRIPIWIKNRLKEDPKKFKQDMEALKRSDEEYDNFSYGYEEYKTPRVCFSNSINGAINSIVGETSKLRLHEQTLYVYVPEKPVSEYKVKTNKQINKDGDVFDSRATNETWILEPVKLKFYGTIVVDKVTRQPFDVKFSNDTHKTIAKYTFEWHWFYKQTKSINEKIRDKKKNGTVNEHFILNEVKRFPVEFDDNGNLTIYKCRMGNIAYGDEIAESVRLLESYRNTSNIEGMKYEISKIWFLIQSLEKKIQKKKTSDEEKQIYNRHRTTAINVFKTNLEYIMKIDSEFNFTVYYNNTPFSDNGIRISSGTLKFALSGLKSLIMR